MQNTEATDALTEACRENPMPEGESIKPCSTPCFELFRRAVVKQCQAAWSAVFQIYHRHLLRWARSSKPHKPYEPEDVAQKAWEKFIRAVQPEIFERFMGLFSILGYLKLCVRSVFIDQTRKAKREGKLEIVLKCEWAPDPSPEKSVLDKIISEQFAQEVYTQLDEEETLVFKLTFELDLAPRQIAEHSPHVFPDAYAVSRVKERAFRRLRSNPMLKFICDDL